MALATMVSALEMLSRTDTPERCDTWGLDRAARVSATTMRVMNSGTVTIRPAVPGTPEALAGPGPR